MITLVRRVLLVFTLPVILFGAWWVATDNSTNPYVPPLRDIIDAFGGVWTVDRLRTDVWPSIWRLGAGYALAIVVGVGLGVLIGRSRRTATVLEPVLEFFRAIPPPVLVPVIMLFAGIGNTMKVVVILSGCVWPILLNTVAGVRALDEVLADTCRSYGIVGPARLYHLILRSASPQIITGMRQALSIGIILMVISEMFAASNGLGFTVVQFQRSFAIVDMWTGILVLGLLGVVLSLLFRLMESRVLAWHRGLRETQRQS